MFNKSGHHSLIPECVTCEFIEYLNYCCHTSASIRNNFNQCTSTVTETSIEGSAALWVEDKLIPDSQRKRQLFLYTTLANFAYL
jgi:hypothetical protein